MNNFLEKFKSDFDEFIYLDLQEYEELLDKILAYANQNQESFVKDVISIPLEDDAFVLSLILEALIKESKKWGDFIFELLKLIISKIKQVETPKTIVNHIINFEIITFDKTSLAQRIVDRLYDEIDINIIEIKNAILWTLLCFIDHENINNKKEIITKIQSQLKSNEYKVRLFTYDELNKKSLLPNDYKLSFKDKLYKILFGTPSVF